MEVQEEKIQEKQLDQQRKGIAQFDTYLKRVGKAKEVYLKKPSISSWGVGVYKIVNMSLKRKEDAAIAKKLDALKAQFGKWRMRVPLTREYFVPISVMDDSAINNDSDGDEEVNLDDFEEVHTQKAAV